MFTGVAISTLRQYVPLHFLSNVSAHDIKLASEFDMDNSLKNAITIGFFVLIIGAIVASQFNQFSIVEQIISFLIGAIFALGLMVSGMTR